MTQTQQSQYMNMIGQAIINNIAIIGKGTVKATGQQFYIVSSSNGVDCYHVMIEGKALVCHCRAAQNNRYCSHRAIVRSHLIASAQLTPSELISVAQPAAAVTRAHETFRNAPAMSIYR